MTAVFETRLRDDDSAARRSEPRASFLDRVDDEAFARVRSLIDEWYGHLQDRDVREELRRRLRHPDDRVFLGSFWELYLHEAFRRLGCELEPHPAVDSGDKHPDWLVSPPNGEPFYVEATLVAPKDADSDPLQNQLLDRLNGVRDTNFLLWVEILKPSAQTPSAKAACDHVDAWLEALDPDEIAAAYRAAGSNALPTTTWRGAGWKLWFQARPRSEKARGRSDLRSVGVVGSGGFRTIDDVGPVRRALKEKATRYGRLDHPYVVALASMGLSVDWIAVEDALFGGVRSEGGPRVDGFWGNVDEPRNTRVSAVIFAWNLLPSSVLQSTPHLFHNPWPERAFRFDHPWGASVFDDRAQHLATSTAARTPSDLFGLPPEWPGNPDLS